MMTDDETRQAIEDMTQSTADGGLTWLRRDGSSELICDVGGFTVVIKTGQDYELHISNEGGQVISKVAPDDNRPATERIKLEGLLYSLAKTAETVAKTEDGARFIQAVNDAAGKAKRG